jgi:hypothetical protein
MSDGRSSKRQVAVGRKNRQIEENTKKLCELVADLPFRRMILQEIWERQQREVRSKRHPSSDEKRAYQR